MNTMTRHKPNNTSKASSTRSSIIERLFADRTWTENYRVTAEERESLSNAAMMGEVCSERDVLFILNQIRRARLRW
jgi:hypothetical protein